MQAHGIMFHHFHGKGHHYSQGAITSEEFEDILRFAGIENIISAKKWLELQSKNALKPEHICLTFDDTLRCQYDIAVPVLDKLGIQAFWFVYSSVLEGELSRLDIYRKFRSEQFDDIEKFYESFFNFLQKHSIYKKIEQSIKAFPELDYLKEYGLYSDADRLFRYSRDQLLGQDVYEKIMDEMIFSHGLTLKGLSEKLWLDAQCIKTLHNKGHVIGLHSHSHPTVLSALSKQDQQKEYKKNADVIEAVVGEKPVSMSHPCNSYNGETLEVLKSLGIRLGFRSNMFQKEHGDLEFPRTDHSHLIREIRQKEAQ